MSRETVSRNEIFVVAILAMALVLSVTIIATAVVYSKHLDHQIKLEHERNDLERRQLDSEVRIESERLDAEREASEQPEAE